MTTYSVKLASIVIIITMNYIIVLLKYLSNIKNVTKDCLKSFNVGKVLKYRTILGQKDTHGGLLMGKRSQEDFSFDL